MERREFVLTGLAGALEFSATTGTGSKSRSRPQAGRSRQASPRDLFPRLRDEVFVNGAGGTPLGRFAEDGIARYLEFARLGPGNGRGAWWGEVWGGVRGRFAALIGARESEIGLVECTKAGEQLVLDGLAALRRGGNVVTNDLHFGGSLHNLEGLRRGGVDVRVVRSENFAVSLDRMADAIDDRTALVSVSLVSNVNGHIEPMAELAAIAHDHGAVVFADIIQAAGIVPISVDDMGIDVAACSSYKWLYGIHGAGFLYVRDELQGEGIPDTLFPGHSRRAYPPFHERGADGEAFTFSARSDATRYQPGHVNYLGYAAVHEGLGFIDRMGVEALQRHTVALNRHLVDQLDLDGFRVLTPDLSSAPILSLEVPDVEATLERLMASEVVVSVGGDKANLVRISPAIYNTEADMDRVAEVLSG